MVLSVGIGAPTDAAADPALQPPPTASDHLITEVPGLVDGRELGALRAWRAHGAPRKRGRPTR
ncbi:hypothetical protein [Clavibacter zhangzhiyongii]|uniref:hypothetical protein n=1 Tax=Clavibacter zhangzhiyongii TaxID=2768071 RepID=UPI0039DFDAC3